MSDALVCLATVSDQFRLFLPVKPHLQEITEQQTDIQGLTGKAKCTYSS